jgi:hypothetical protein
MERSAPSLKVRARRSTPAPTTPELRPCRSPWPAAGKGRQIVPSPGTKRVSRIEENTGADGLTLTADQTATLDRSSRAEGAHHT